VSGPVSSSVAPSSVETTRRNPHGGRRWGGLRRWGPDLVFPLLLALYLGWAYAPGVFEGHLYLSEDIGQFVGFRSELRHLGEGRALSLWNDLPGLGIPRFSNPQVGYFSPFSLGFLVMPTLRVMSLEPAVLFWSLGLATWFFFRISGLGRGAASFGACAWLGVGMLMGHAAHPTVLACLFWMPVALACWTRFSSGKTGFWAALGGGALACMVWAGHFQYLLYGGALVACWVSGDLWRARRNRREFFRLALGAGGMGLGALLLGLVQLLPVLEMGGLCQRMLVSGRGFADQYRATPQELLGYLVAERWLLGERPLQAHGQFRLDSGVSLLVVGLAGWGLIRGRRLAPFLGAAVFLLGMLGTQGPVMALLGQVPGLDMIRAPVRMFVPAAFLLAWVAAWGLQHAVSSLRQGTRLWVCGMACLWVLALGQLLNRGDLRWIRPEELVLPAPLVGLEAGRAAPDPLTLPQPLIGALPASGVPTLVVWNPVVPRNYFEAMFASQVGSLEQADKVNLAISIGSLFPMSRPDLPLMRSFDLRRVVGVRDGVLHQLEVPPAGGRFFVVPRGRVLASEAEGWVLARDETWDPQATALVREPFPEGEGGPTRVQVLKDHPDAQDLLVEGGGGLLVVSGLFYPGWQARLDGQSAPIVQANLALRAVAVPPGLHRVEWRYRPWWAVPAFMGWLLGLMVLICLARKLPANPAPGS